MTTPATRTLLERGFQLLHQGDLLAAEHHGRDALKLDANEAAAANLIGDQLACTGAPRRGREFFLQLVELEPRERGSLDESGHGAARVGTIRGGAGSL